MMDFEEQAEGLIDTLQRSSREKAVVMLRARLMTAFYAGVYEALQATRTDTSQELGTREKPQ